MIVSTPRSPSGPTPARPRRYRVDGGRGSGDELAPGQGSLLRAFNAWAVPAERRADGRHTPAECQATLGWRTWRRRTTLHALVIDVSRGGAKVFLDAPPPRDRAVRVGLTSGGREAVIEARVLEVRRTAGGQCLARLEFLQPCPYDLFGAAVCGLAPAHRPVPRFGPPGGPGPAKPAAGG